MVRAEQAKVDQELQAAGSAPYFFMGPALTRKIPLQSRALDGVRKHIKRHSKFAVQDAESFDQALILFALGMESLIKPSARLSGRQKDVALEAWQRKVNPLSSFTTAMILKRRMRIRPCKNSMSTGTS